MQISNFNNNNPTLNSEQSNFWYIIFYAEIASPPSFELNEFRLYVEYFNVVDYPVLLCYCFAYIALFIGEHLKKVIICVNNFL